MTKSQKILVGAAVAAVLIGAFVLTQRPVAHQPTPAPATSSMPPEDMIDVSKVVFDAKTTIPDTGVTFSYPKNGFYGKGVTLTKSDRSPLQALQNVANYYLESGHQQVSLNVYKLNDEKTLEDAMATVGGQMTDVPLGHYQDMNGMRFFLVPSDTSKNVYTAYTLVKGQLLAVTFDGGFTVSDPSSVPDFVTLFLNHLDFTCASDCSVNSAQVVEEHMPTEGQ